MVDSEVIDVAAWSNYLSDAHEEIAVDVFDGVPMPEKRRGNLPSGSIVPRLQEILHGTRSTRVGQVWIL